MSKDLKFFGAHRADGKPDDCVIAHVGDDGKITYEVQGNFAALFIAGINHANGNEKFRDDLVKLAVATEMAEDNIGIEEAFKKIQQIKPISAHNENQIKTDESKKIKKREIVCELHDPMNSKLNLITYEDTSVDIELEGNKAGIIIQLLLLVQNNPEAIESIIDTLNKVADLNLHIFQSGGIENCVVVSGFFRDILDNMCSEKDPVVKANGLGKLITQIEDENDMLKFMEKVEKEPDFLHKQDILAIAYHRIVTVTQNSDILIDILAKVQKQDNLPHKEGIISLGSEKLKNKLKPGASC